MREGTCALDQWLDGLAARIGKYEPDQGVDSVLKLRAFDRNRDSRAQYKTPADCDRRAFVTFTTALDYAKCGDLDSPACSAARAPRQGGYAMINSHSHIRPIAGGRP
jgi:hypothetical protein